MVHPHFQLLQIVTAFSQLHDYMQTIFETSVMQAGTKMERSNSSKIEDKKVWANNKICLLFQTLMFLLTLNFSLTKNCSYFSASNDTFTAAKMLLLSLILASVCFC